MVLRNFVVCSLVLFSASLSYGKGSFIGNLGLTQGRIVLGGEYEMRSKRSHGLGGYALIETSDEDKGRYQVMLLGGHFKVFFGPNRWQMYLAPGFGLALADISTIAGVIQTIETQTLFGPTLSYGVLYRFSKTLSFGLELKQFFNWFSDHVAAGAQYNFNTAIVKYSF